MANNQKAIKAIIFDFIGVLLFKKEHYQSDPIIDAIDSKIGNITDDTQFKKETLKEHNISEDQFYVIMNRIADKYEPFKKIWNLLPELKGKYKLAIINNGTAFTLNLFKKKYQTEDYFELFVSSAIEGIKKPNVEIFLLTAKRLGIDPENCLFMDDYPLNIESAKNCGMKTIHWENKEIGYKKFVDFLKNIP